LSSRASGEVEEYAGQEGQALGGPADMSVSASLHRLIRPAFAEASCGHGKGLVASAVGTKEMLNLGALGPFYKFVKRASLLEACGQDY